MKEITSHMKRFPDYFADAEADFNEADYIIFGVPYDRTSSFRYGARMAPKEIRQASWNFESFHFLTETDLTKIKMHDYGDLDVSDERPEDMIKEVRRFVKRILDKGGFPIAIGGEHSITSGIVDALSETYKDMAVLFLDAHLDFRNSYEKERYNHACTLRRITETVGVENVAAVGIRSAEKGEYYLAKKKGLFFIDSFNIFSDGMDDGIKVIKEKFREKKVYISLDMDVLDPSHAPAVSTPEPFGLIPSDVLKCIETFSSQAVGFDVVEVCPPYDSGETSLLAAKMIRSAMDSFWRSKR